MITVNTPMTPEQLLTLPDSKGLEIVAGKLVEKHVGIESNEIGLLIAYLLIDYSRKHRVGRVLGYESGFHCFPHDPSMIRKPDVAFLSYDKAPADKVIGAYSKVAPEIAIEVLSPNDVFKEVSEKVSDYLAAGVNQVWVVNPFRKQVEVHTSAGTKVLSASDELTAEAILPGFRCQVGELFAGIPTVE
jgi:Uma2 family endonuclease